MMQTTKVPIVAPYRPQIKRMKRRDLQETQTSNDFDYSSTVSSNRWQNRRQSQVAPEISSAWRPNIEPPRNPADDEKKCFVNRTWLWVFGGFFCLILVLAVVGIVLGLVLPSTTSSTSLSSKMLSIKSEVYAVNITCSNTDRGSIEVLNGSIPSGWTSYSYNYSATNTAPTLLFGFETDGTHTYYLDNVSVVDNSMPLIELLSNPDFENSTIYATDWIQSCETTCTGQIVSGSQCFGSSGNCFMVFCNVDNSSISFLSQSFMATIGNIYTISFMLNYAGNASTEIISFYFDVI